MPPAISTRPSFVSNVAVCSLRGTARIFGPLKVLVAGSNTWAKPIGVPDSATPPAINTVPFLRSVAVWPDTGTGRVGSSSVY